MRWRYVPLMVVGALCALFIVSLSAETRVLKPRSVDTNTPLPAFSLRALTKGQPQITAEEIQSAGEPVIINFFASWCLTCRIEHPSLQDVSQETNIPIYGFSWRDQPADTQKWLDKMGNFYSRIGVDDRGETAIAFGLTGVPETYVIGANGRIAGVHKGPVTEQVKKEWLLPLLQSLSKAQVGNAPE